MGSLKKDDKEVIKKIRIENLKEATGMNEYTKYGVVPTIGGHYDHGHLGLSNINVEIVSL